MRQQKKNLKKNLTEKKENLGNKSIFFFDESRFGTHSKVGHGWFTTGSRTNVKVALGFKSFYVYGAVEPATGENFSLILPGIDSENFNIFINDFSIYLKEKTVLLIMDNAPWHKSGLVRVAKNIEIMYLPPYSPDLNPIERLWAFIKKHTIRNRIYKDVEELMDTISFFLKNLHAEDVASICNDSYLYI